MNTRQDTRITTIRPGIDYAAFDAYLAKVNAQLDVHRQVELLNHADATGIPLPMSPAAIMELEDRGGVVDLATGAVTWPQDGAQ